VDEKRVNMVVMGTKGETNLASKMMGSITESMIRHSRVPVLALPPGEDKDSLEHIVIASDDLNESRQEVLLHCLNDMNLLRPRFTYLFVDKGTVSGSLPKSIPMGGHQVAVHIE
jgi:hypothetical protein